jgi:hypothetical protein
LYLVLCSLFSSTLIEFPIAPKQDQAQNTKYKAPR